MSKEEHIKYLEKLAERDWESVIVLKNAKQYVQPFFPFILLLRNF
jgi:hypothetical protein